MKASSHFKTLVQSKIDSGDMLDDEHQAQLINALSSLQEELQPKSPFMARLISNWFKRQKRRNVPKGVYAWGGVGRGKTFLMDMFYDTAPTQNKWRIHFHRFMQWVHEQNGQMANKQNPLKHVAKLVSTKNNLLCLDEFMVTDIADAMILYRLLKHLYDQGVVIVTTSNTAPDDLYAKGIGRESFLPAIALLKANSRVIFIKGQNDYRKRAWVYGDVFFSPLGPQAKAGLLRCHTRLTGLTSLKPKTISIAGRDIEALSVTKQLAWFDFDEICQSYRSQNDYIQLGNQFSILIIESVPKLSEQDDAAARRFINLVDTSYDYGVILVLSSANNPDNIYVGSKLAEPFKRTASRLWEMASPKYLSHYSN